MPRKTGKSPAASISPSTAITSGPSNPSEPPSDPYATRLYGPATEVRPDTALDSAAHVKVAAKGTSGGELDEILITLSIDPLHHVNANPASADYLIPTLVTIPGAADAKISYPPGRAFKPKFSQEAISVYEGSAAIRAVLPKGWLASAGNAQVSVEVQACTAQTCLAPATLTAPVAR